MSLARAAVLGALLVSGARVDAGVIILHPFGSRPDFDDGS